MRLGFRTERRDSVKRIDRRTSNFIGSAVGLPRGLLVHFGCSGARGAPPALPPQGDPARRRPARGDREGRGGHEAPAHHRQARDRRLRGREDGRDRGPAPGPGPGREEVPAGAPDPGDGLLLEPREARGPEGPHSSPGRHRGAQAVQAGQLRREDRDEGPGARLEDRLVREGRREAGHRDLQPGHRRLRHGLPAGGHGRDGQRARQEAGEVPRRGVPGAPGPLALPGRVHQGVQRLPRRLAQGRSWPGPRTSSTGRRTPSASSRWSPPTTRRSTRARAAP